MLAYWRLMVRHALSADSGERRAETCTAQGESTRGSPSLSSVAALDGSGAGFGFGAGLGQSAPELRKLRKTQGAEAQRICKEGGQRILSSIGVPKVYRVTLADLPDDFWQQTERSLDGKHPILYLREL